MAAKNDDTETDADSLEGFGAPASPDDSGTGTIKLDPGEHVTGEITAVDLDAGDGAGLVEIDGRTYWLNWTMRAQLLDGLVGNEIAVVKDPEDEAQTFVNDEGDEQEYWERNLLHKEDD